MPTTDLTIGVVTGIFAVGGTLGGVWLSAVIDGRRRRHDETRREKDISNQQIREVVGAGENFRDAMRVYRSITAGRRLVTAGVATGVDLAGQYLVDKPDAGKVAFGVAALRDVMKMGGLYDRVQVSNGERYQAVVSPTLQALTTATTVVRLGHDSPLQNEAAKVLGAAGALADEALSAKREYKRAEVAFEQALQDFQNVAPTDSPRRERARK